MSAKAPPVKSVEQPENLLCIKKPNIRPGNVEKINGHVFVKHKYPVKTPEEIAGAIKEKQKRFKQDINEMIAKNPKLENSCHFIKETD